MALRRDGAQWGAVAGCNGGRKVSRRGCQPRFWDQGAVPIPVTSTALGRESKEAVVASVAAQPRDARLAGALPRQRVAPAVPRPRRVALAAGTKERRAMSRQQRQGAGAEPLLPLLSCPTHLLQPTVGCSP